jgi:hypothetical protein
VGGVKALRVIAYDGSIGLIWVICGLIALVLSSSQADRALDTFGIVISTVLAVVVAAFGSWLHAQLGMCDAVPAGVVSGTRLELAWRVVLAALPAAPLVQLAIVANGNAWVGGVSFVGLGVVMLSIAVRAAGIERQRGGRLVRVKQRYYLAH